MKARFYMKKVYLYLVLFLMCTITSGFSHQMLLEKDGHLVMVLEHATFKMDAKGQLVSIQLKDGQELIDGSEVSTVLRVQNAFNTPYEVPKQVTWEPVDHGYLLHFGYEKSSAEVLLSHRGPYIKMELLSLKGAPCRVISWGKIMVSMQGTIGEILGVMYNDQDAFGMMSLNLNTVGGKYKDDGQFDYLEAVSKTKSGGAFQLSSKDRTFKDLGQEGFAYFQEDVVVKPIPGETAVGSKIALYCVPRQQLDSTVENIELNEGLLHPVLDHKWMKKHTFSSSSKLIINFGIDTIDDCIRLARKSGIECLYHMDAFESWGHFEPSKKYFPRGYEDVKICYEKAKKAGITLGAHTLSNFIHPHDPLVSPVPHQGLQTSGRTAIKTALSASDDVIELSDDVDIKEYLRRENFSSYYAVRIGDEIVEYSKCTSTKPYQLIGCKRGAFGTVASSHQAGSQIAKLASMSYKVFLPDIELQDFMSVKLADFFNKSGFKRISFDGLEGCRISGHGYYASNRFVKVFYDHLHDKNIVSNASIFTHVGYHYFSNQSWGEPWYGGFRDSMMDHRFRSVRTMHRNLLPSKLGQFGLGDKVSLEDVNWVMGICAGYDSGLDFYMTPKFEENNAEASEILKAISHWEKSRSMGMFSESEKVELRNTNTIYKVDEVEGSYQLKFIKDWVKEKETIKKNKMTLTKSLFGKVTEHFDYSVDHHHVNKPREPGQPTAALLKVKRGRHHQNLSFVLRSIKENKEHIEGAYFKIGAMRSEVPFTIQPGNYLVALGDGKISLYASDATLIEVKPFEDLIMYEGDNEVEFNYTREGLEPGPEVILNFRTYKTCYNLAQGKPTTSYNNSQKSALANDGLYENSDAHWHGVIDGRQVWWQVDLEKVENVKRLAVLPFYAGGPRYYQYTIEGSVDGQRWKLLVDHSNNETPVTVKGYDHKIKATNARYLRVNMLKHSQGNFVHLVEFMAYDKL